MNSEEPSPEQPARPPSPAGTEGLASPEPPALTPNPAKRSAGGGAWVPPALAELSRLLPEYCIEALLGHGGMGAVYKGRQIALDRPVAIKLLPIEVAANERFVSNFRREARTLARLQHPGIVNVYDFGQTSEGHLYFVMEFVDGTDLRQILDGPGLDPAEALGLISQVCDTLHYAHSEGVIHRDIKPGNILVTTEGRAKLADFGLARPITGNTSLLTGTQTLMGTAEYMAPEQQDGHADQRADIYALGVMLYEMLTGQRPSGVFDPPSRRVQVDIRLDGVVLKALQNEPARRYQQVSEMKTDVDHIRTTPSERIPAAKEAAKASSKRRVALITAALIAASAVVGAVMWKVGQHRQGKVVAVGKPQPEWKTLLSASFADSSPFGTHDAPTWTSALSKGLFTLRRRDSGGLWLGADHSEAGSATRIKTEARIASDGIFNQHAAESDWGLLFRRSDQGHYILRIRGDGHWRLVAHRKEQKEDISPWTFSPALRKAGEFNKTQVEAIGSRITIQANGVTLGEFNDDTFESGAHSLYFGSPGDAFFEFKNYELSEQVVQAPEE